MIRCLVEPELMAYEHHWDADVIHRNGSWIDVEKIVNGDMSSRIAFERKICLGIADKKRGKIVGVVRSEVRLAD